MLLLVWPFGQLPYIWSLAAWSFLWLGLYLWTSIVGRSDTQILLLALLLAPATFANFSGRQHVFLSGPLLIGGLRLLGTISSVPGILFGLLTVTPPLGILLPFALLPALPVHAFTSGHRSSGVPIRRFCCWRCFSRPPPLPTVPAVRTASGPAHC